MERHDLEAIAELVWYHHNVDRIDASIYGLPADDLDDRSLLTIDERLRFRAAKASLGVQLATTGPLQYPHHLRAALDHQYQLLGVRPDCASLLDGASTRGAEDKSIGSGWHDDVNLTDRDSLGRGEVDITIDRRNPRRVFVASCPAVGVESSNFFAATDDWGRSWTFGHVGNNRGSTWECDPVSFYDAAADRLVHARIGCLEGCTQTRAMLRSSGDNGRTWEDCAPPGQRRSEDRVWITGDNSPTSACYGTLYATWNVVNEQQISRSTDACTSWSKPTSLTGRYQAVSPDLAVAADGHVYAVWQNQGDRTFKLSGSDDCGATWRAPATSTIRPSFGEWSNSIPAQCRRGVPAAPSIDVDRNLDSAFFGRVYLALFDFNRAGCSQVMSCSSWRETCNFDISFTFSDDNGATWAEAVNLTEGDGALVDHFLGSMRVDDSDGSIYVGFHRSRLNPTELGERQRSHFFVIRSTDGGATWSEPYRASSVEGDERRDGASTFERGDYNRIDAHDGVVWAAWIDRRGVAGEEEVIVRKVCSPPAHWSERAPHFTAPELVAESVGSDAVELVWDLPDLYWGDGGEQVDARRFQLWVDEELVEDGIAPDQTSVVHIPADCSAQHTYEVRAVNQCGLVGAYQQVTARVADCCPEPPTVAVLPDGPLQRCTRDSQVLIARVEGDQASVLYQWERDGIPIAGADSASYDVSDTGTHMYNCQVRLDGCELTSTDRRPTKISWISAPEFDGLESVSPVAGDDCAFELGWKPASSICPGPVTYAVYRSSSFSFAPDAMSRIASGVTSTRFVDASELEPGTTYSYLVRAVDAATGDEDDNGKVRQGSCDGVRAPPTPVSTDRTSLCTTGEVIGSGEVWWVLYDDGVEELYVQASIQSDSTNPVSGPVAGDGSDLSLDRHHSDQGQEEDFVSLVIDGVAVGRAAFVGSFEMAFSSQPQGDTLPLPDLIRPLGAVDHVVIMNQERTPLLTGSFLTPCNPNS